MLKFGPGGIPLTTKYKGVLEGIKRVHEVGLDCMELEFVRSTFVDEEKAPEVKKISEDLSVSLSVHGSYFINLASKEKPKFYASINRIVSNAKIGHLCGARALTFHPAFMQGRVEGEVFKLVKRGLEKVFDEIDKDGYKIRINPELTGKPSQFGSLDSLIRLVKEMSGEGYNLGFCLDFAHNFARTAGQNNKKEEIEAVIKKVEKELGKEFLKDMHIHMSGIIFSDKGERYHVTFLDSHEKYVKEGIEIEGFKEIHKQLKKNEKLGGSDFNWKGILEVLKKQKVGGLVICESPNLEQDAVLMKEYYESL